MSVLSGHTIKSLCVVGGSRVARPLIWPFDERHLSTASYDLCLGDRYLIGDAKEAGEPIQLDRGQRLTIPANQVVVVEMREALRLPDHLVGHLSLKMHILLSGIVIASQSQIDAGYEGRIFAMLFNLNSRDVHVSEGDEILRLEFARLDVPAPKYVGDMRNKRLSRALLPYKTVESSMGNLAQRFEAFTKRTQRDLAIAVAVSVLGMIVGLGGIMATIIDPFTENAQDAKSKVEVQQTKLDELQQLVDQLPTLQRRIADLEQAQDSARR